MYTKYDKKRDAIYYVMQIYSFFKDFDNTFLLLLIMLTSKPKKYN